jgi:hypothetical protein
VGRDKTLPASDPINFIVILAVVGSFAHNVIRGQPREVNLSGSRGNNDTHTTVHQKLGTCNIRSIVPGAAIFLPCSSSLI